MADPSLIQSAGVAAEGLVVVSAIDPTNVDSRWQEFQKRYQKRFNAAPDAYASYGYDGAMLLVSAIQKAGLDRLRIDNVLREYENEAYFGVSGTSRFNKSLNNVSPVMMARVEGGRFVYWRPRR